MEINSLIVVYVRDLDKFQEMCDNDTTVGYLLVHCQNITRGRDVVSDHRMGPRIFEFSMWI